MGEGTVGEYRGPEQFHGRDKFSGMTISVACPPNGVGGGRRAMPSPASRGRGCPTAAGTTRGEAGPIRWAAGLPAHPSSREGRHRRRGDCGAGRGHGRGGAVLTRPPSPVSNEHRGDKSWGPNRGVFVGYGVGVHQNPRNGGLVRATERRVAWGWGHLSLAYSTSHESGCSS